MFVQDFDQMSIVAKTVADRCDGLVKDSRHGQSVLWKNRSYEVCWGLNFDELQFKIYVYCTNDSEPKFQETFVWPNSGSPESDGDALAARIGNHLAALGAADEWPSTLPGEWLLEEQAT